MTTNLTATLSFGDYLAANVLYQRRYWLWSGLLKLVGGVGLVFFLLMLALTALDGPLTWSLVVAQLVAALLFGLGMAVIIPIISLIKMRLKAPKIFEQMSLALPITYEIDNDGVRAANEQGTATLTWDRFSDFVQDRRLILLRRTPLAFFILPKAHLSSDELETILACLRAAGVQEG